MSDEIDALQAVAVAATAGARSNKGSLSAGEVINLADDVTNNNSRKRPFQSLTSPVARLSNSQPFSHFGSSKKQPRSGKKNISTQDLEWGTRSRSFCEDGCCGGGYDPQ